MGSSPRPEASPQQTTDELLAERGLALKTTQPTLAVGSTAADVPTITIWGDVWRRLRRNRLAIIGSAIVLALVLTAILAPLISPYSPNTQNLELSLHAPSLKHWFGTDILGRDYFSRVVYGSRISISIGIVATLIALVIGLTLGAIAGYLGGPIDALTMRVADIFFAFPFIVGAIIVITALGRGFPRLLALFLAIGFFGWATVARLFRASILQVRTTEYVEAARALGASGWRILVRHIIPNSLAPVIVYSMVGAGTAILTEAALSFLGLGLSAGTPAWGLMVSEGKSFMTTRPWLVLFPGIGIVLTVLGFIFVGDGLRDSMDPRLR